jgi:hypothetical protein
MQDSGETAEVSRGVCTIIASPFYYFLSLVLIDICNTWIWLKTSGAKAFLFAGITTCSILTAPQSQTSLTPQLPGRAVQTRAGYRSYAEQTR